MTYNNVEGAACSARGIAHRENREDLERLAQELGDKINNIKITKVLSEQSKDEENEKH